MLIELNDYGYSLTPLGKELMQLIAPLREWSKQWEESLKD